MVDNCGLEELVIEDCPNLKTLSFRFNKVKEIDLNGLGLEALYCSGNELDKLDLKGLKEYDEVIIDEEGKEVKTGLKKTLKHLVCDNNPIKQLEIKHLENLESLYCFKCKLDNLDCSGLSELKELYCANSTIELLILDDGCNNLENLDCAENSLQELVVSDKPNLKSISVKENILRKLYISNLPSLEFLDFSRQEIVVEDVEDGEIEAFLPIQTALSIKNSSNIRKMFYDKAAIVPN